jgi:hypothetical protein
VALLAACSGTPTRYTPASESESSNTAAYATHTYPGLPRFVDHSIGQEEVSIEAMGLVGVPYRWGGNTPVSGFDCSGLVRYVVARAAGVDMPRTTSEMSTRGTPIQPDEIAPGDLIFFNTTGRPHSHVGIYVGNMRFVNAPATGGTVRIDYVSNPYWAKHFDGIRRVAPVRDTPAPFDGPAILAAPAPAPVAPVMAPATATQAQAQAGTAANTPAFDAIDQAAANGATDAASNGYESQPTSSAAQVRAAAGGDDPIARFADGNF